MVGLQKEADTRAGGAHSSFIQTGDAHASWPLPHGSTAADARAIGVEAADLAVVDVPQLERGHHALQVAVRLQKNAKE